MKNAPTTFSRIIGLVLGAAATVVSAADLSRMAEPPRDQEVEAYAIVVSSRTLADPGWAKVVEILKEKHHGTVIAYSGGQRDWLAPLRAVFPKYACFVARPEELGLESLLAIQRQTRQLDDDPYTDVVWGIVTGSSAEEARKLAEVSQPLVACRGLAGNRMDLAPFDEGVWFYEGADAVAQRKLAGGRESPLPCTLDNARQIVDLLNSFDPQYVQTSGHANPRRWNIGYGCDRGHFMARNGVLYGVDRAGHELAVHSPGSKIYLPYRNCLVGLVQDRDSLALGWMGSAGVKQMAGYIVPTWNGAAGNGIRKWLFDRPGEYTFSEAFYFNQQMLMRGLSPRAQACMPSADQYQQEKLGEIAKMLKLDDSQYPGGAELAGVWDRDALVFYGDPAWDAHQAGSRHGAMVSFCSREYVHDRCQIGCSGTGQPFRLMAASRAGGRVAPCAENAQLICDKFVEVSADVPKGTTEVLSFRGERLLGQPTVSLRTAGKPAPPGNPRQ